MTRLRFVPNPIKKSRKTLAGYEHRVSENRYRHYLLALSGVTGYVSVLLGNAPNVRKRGRGGGGGGGESGGGGGEGGL